MSWVKLDDQFPDHPKVVQAGPRAAWLYVCGLAYCARYLTDGLIPKAQVGRLAAFQDCVVLAATLAHVGLWIEVGDSYRIHDWLDYNPTREQVKATREARAKAGQIGGWQKAKQTPSKLPDICLADATPLASTPVPVPVPVPNQDQETVPTFPANGVAHSAASDSTETPANGDQPRRRPLPKLTPAEPPDRFVEFDAILRPLRGYVPTTNFFKALATKYVHADLVTEAVKIEAWLTKHPKRDCSVEFVLNWLAKLPPGDLYPSEPPNLTAEEYAERYFKVGS